MSTKLKLLPAFVMLMAGAFTSIITFVIGYTLKSALIILLFVLIVFYILGLVLQKLIVNGIVCIVAVHQVVARGLF